MRGVAVPVAIVLMFSFQARGQELKTFYRDADGDGFGDPTKHVKSQVPPRIKSAMTAQ